MFSATTLAMVVPLYSWNQFQRPWNSIAGEPYQLPDPMIATLCFLVGESEAMVLQVYGLLQESGDARVTLERLETAKVMLEWRCES